MILSPQGLIALCIISFASVASAAPLDKDPNLADREAMILLKTDDLTLPEQALKEGSSEIGTSMNLGYDSFHGLVGEVSGSYRYFFADNQAMGLVARRVDQGDYKVTTLGFSYRNYFYQTGSWAMSVTGNALASYGQEYVSPIFQGEFFNLALEAQLGAHYFVNENMSLDLTLANRWTVMGDGPSTFSREPSGLTGLFGVTFRF